MVKIVQNSPKKLTKKIKEEEKKKIKAFFLENGFNLKQKKTFSKKPDHNWAATYRPEGAKDKVKRPEGPPARSWAP